MAFGDSDNKAKAVPEDKIGDAYDGDETESGEANFPGAETKKSAKDNKLTSGDAMDNDPASGTIPVPGNE